MPTKPKIKKGDVVKVLAGKDRGKTGKVLKVLPREGRVLVEGVNVYKKHVRAKREGGKGETIEIIRPLHLSNVVFLCPSCGRPAKVMTEPKSETGEERRRLCRKCKHTI